MGDMTKHKTRYTSPALTQKLFANMRRVGKGATGVENPLFPTMLVQPAEVYLTEAQADECINLAERVADLEKDRDSQALEIIKLKKRIKQLERPKKFKYPGLRRLRK
ncbi:hypothetical protein Tco_0944417, partial [Tanacetum coccineum]